ncbi:hypothetical protein LXL04_016716 [Taraxacum kok-saghyz]
MPVGGSMSKVGNWSFLADNFHPKLSTWKARTLSMGGRLTLCKSVLGSLGLHIFSMCPWCSSVDETEGHIFAECRTAAKLLLNTSTWANSENSLNFPPVVNSLDDLLSSNHPSKSKEKEVWDAISPAFLWTIWNFRNEFVFEGKFTNRIKEANRILPNDEKAADVEGFSAPRWSRPPKIAVQQQLRDGGGGRSRTRLTPFGVRRKTTKELVEYYRPHKKIFLHLVPKFNLSKERKGNGWKRKENKKTFRVPEFK